jgi:chemotaxis protein methyltransferase CheR
MKEGDGKAAEASISPALFVCFQQLIYRESGIWLAPHKTALLCGRLARRLQRFGCKSMTEYFTIVSRPDAVGERQQMLNCIATNETRFFREQQHFDFLEHKLFPTWRREVESGKRPRRIRVWSAGCSTGQEPYSVAMLLLHSFKSPARWCMQILATDLSTHALETAREALYPATQVPDIPQHYLHGFMLRGMEEQRGWIKPSAEVRSLVTFRQLNLTGAEPPSSELFDLIFCRNVMIYFDIESKHKAMVLLTQRLAPGGLLLIGHSENLHGMMPGLKTIVPTIYSYQRPCQ